MNWSVFISVMLSGIGILLAIALPIVIVSKVQDYLFEKNMGGKIALPWSIAMLIFIFYAAIAASWRTT
jgi:hypothetical protein